MAKRERPNAGGADMKLYQQGDVLLFSEVIGPKTLRSRLDGVLATGEATGHAHRLAEATDGLLYEAEDGTLYLRVGAKGATITHEEHRPITVPPGDYRVGRVQEYDHFAEEARRVRD